MADVSYTDRAKIDAILAESSRLRYLLTETYGVKPAEITSIRVDGDNIKVDVNVGPRMLRFKAKGTENALVPDPSAGGVKMTFDPALAQALYNLVDEFGRG
jgi:hypothetical protein